MSPRGSSTEASSKDLVQWAREALKAESDALAEASARIGDAFADAARAVIASSGKVVVTGLGKSGHVARKLAATLSSTGTSAFFLHPSEALHGDFGMVQKHDILVAVAYGGETNEVNEVARFARRIGLKVVSITGGTESTLARLSHFVLDGRVAREADVLNLAPTSSSTVAMALGDALAVAIMRARGFSQGDFASLHPGGSLGRRLSLVRDHMQSGEKLPKVREDGDFLAVLEAVTIDNYGIAAVVDAAGAMIGAISDGDLRRAMLKRGAAALKDKAKDLMSPKPKVIQETDLALDALAMMNEHRISRVFVVGAEHPARPVGLVRLIDLLAAKIL
jgi:arabinose-5-phosphate isomerase